MDILHIEGGDDTPNVLLDKSNGIFEISGRSLPEDSVTFYTPVMNWITEYRKAPNPSTDFTFKLDYFNTASSKIILDLLKMLSEIEGVTIVWYSDEDDEVIKEAGEEYSEQVNVPFVFKAD